MVPCGINPNFSGLSHSRGQIVYALRTRAPVVIKEASSSMLPLDLHVLGLPLAFILSQDQTLHRCFIIYYKSINYQKFPGPDSHPKIKILNSNLYVVS